MSGASLAQAKQLLELLASADKGQLQELIENADLLQALLEARELRMADRKAFWLALRGFEPDFRNKRFVSCQVQLSNIRRWRSNDLLGSPDGSIFWEKFEAVRDAAPTEAEWRTNKAGLVWVLVPATDSVWTSFARLVEILRKEVVLQGFIHPKKVKLERNLVHHDGLEWALVDLEPDHYDDATYQYELAHLEVLAVLAHNPHLLRSDRPNLANQWGVQAVGYQVMADDGDYSKKTITFTAGDARRPAGMYLANWPGRGPRVLERRSCP